MADPRPIDITQEELQRLFTYNGRNLCWKVTRGMAKAGKVAGTVNSRGYIHIRINNRFYQANRLVWIFLTGETLTEFDIIDHKDQDRTNNAFSNLRKCSNSQNGCNSKTPKTSSTGVKNVHRVGDRGFRIECKLNGKIYNSPIYTDVNKAIADRDEFVKRIHGEFATQVVHK